MGVAVTILSLTTVGFFVAFAVFYGKYTDRVRLLQTAQEGNSEVVRADERNRDDIRNLIADAKNNKQSLVGYLLDAQSTTMQLADGSKRDKATDLATKMKAAGIENKDMLAALNERAAEAANLHNQLTQAEAARTKAMADLTSEIDRVSRIESSHQKTVDALNGEVKQLRDEVEQYRAGTDTYKKQIDAQRERMQTEQSEKLKATQEQLSKASEERLVLAGQLAALRKQKTGEIFKGEDESTLVDGTVIGTSPADRQAFISIGARQKAVLGMTFIVYSDKAAIRPDRDGNYPRGKATLEVVNVSDTSSTCRITSEVKGNPVVKGDVIANPLYDPNKSYKFVVFGNFDANRDGVATSGEKADVEAMIQSWGGSVIDDLTGDVDFLVLGERPVPPPRPSGDAPIEVVGEFIRRQADAERWDKLYRQAISTSVPVVNENRLYTLISKTPSRTTP